MQADLDYYQTLGVDRDASIDAIKHGYKKQAMEYHPDKNIDRDTTEIFKKINTAYQVLSDPIDRANYDRWLDNDKSTWNFGLYYEMVDDICDIYNLPDPIKSRIKALVDVGQVPDPSDSAAVTEFYSNVVDRVCDDAPNIFMDILYQSIPILRNTLNFFKKD